MFTILIFIAVLAVLVLTHEAGHFIAARRAGVRVHEFGFGFPPRLAGVWRDAHGRFRWVGFSRLRKMQDGGYHGIPKTLYSLNLIPLGGFVKIKGEDGEHHDAPDSFASKSTRTRAVILSAGVAGNVLTAFVLLSLGFMVGIPSVLGGDLPSGARLSNQAVTVVEVLSGSPAQQAGIRLGDAVLRVSGAEASDAAAALADIRSMATEGEVAVTLRRGEQEFSVALQSAVLEEIGRPAIGVALQDTAIMRLPLWRAVLEGAAATGVYLRDIVRAFGHIIAAAFSDTPAMEQLSGPVGIAVLTGQIARLGLSHLLQFTAVLSLNLALLNFIPIPALDGGRLLFVGIEALRRGQAVSKKTEQTAHVIGFALLVFLVIVVTARDIAGLI